MRKPNLVFMYGEDSFSLSQEIGRWKAAFVEKYTDTNLEEIDGADMKINELQAAISAMPFLADKRLVILKDFLANQKAEEQKSLIPILENLSDTTVLVITETGEPDKRTSLFKNLNTNATVRLFMKPKGMALATWISRRAEAHKGQINSQIANYLLEAVGDDLWKLENEIQKLCLYAQGSQVTPDMIDDLVTGSVEQSIFTMTDQLAKKNMAGALATLKKLQAQGQEAPFLFSMIARQFRLMLEMKALSDARMPANAIASKMGVHPYVVQTTLGQCKNFTHAQLRRALRKLLEIDRRLKTGGLHLRQREEEQYLLAIERVLLSQ